MESIIIVVFILSTLSFAIQLRLFGNKVMAFAWLAVVAAFTYVMHHYAIEQSYSTFKATLGNTSVMMDFVVLLIIEAFGGIFVSIYLIRSHYNESVKKIFKYFKFLPGIIVFPALFYFETFVFLQMPGFDFTLVGIGLSIISALIIGLIYYLIKVGIPEFELQIEVKFFVHLLQLGAGIFLSILLVRLPVNKLAFPENGLYALMTLVGLLLLGLVVGVVWHRFRIKRISKTL